MTRRITALSVHHTALIAAMCGAVFALVLALLLTPVMMMMQSATQRTSGMAVFGSWIMLIIMPVTYFIFGYILTAVWVFMFNLVAPRLGGLPVTFADEEPGAAL